LIQRRIKRFLVGGLVSLHRNGIFIGGERLRYTSSSISASALSEITRIVQGKTEGLWISPVTSQADAE